MLLETSYYDSSCKNILIKSAGYLAASRQYAINIIAQLVAFYLALQAIASYHTSK